MHLRQVPLAILALLISVHWAGAQDLDDALPSAPERKPTTQP
jgi:hypothetical protein